jgi:hypothetical protein
MKRQHIFATLNTSININGQINRKVRRHLNINTKTTMITVFTRSIKYAC